MSYGDTIFKTIQAFSRRAHIPDLHSFVADIKNGTVYVECRGFEVMMESREYDSEWNETVKTWCGTEIAAANRLERMGIKLETITF